MTDVLVVGDTGTLDPVAAELEAVGWTVHRATAPGGALSLLDVEPVAGVVAEASVGELGGVDLLRRVREAAPGVATVLVVGDEPGAALNRASAAGLDHVLSAEAADPGELADGIRRAVADQRLTDRRERHRDHREAVWRAARAAVTADGRDAIEAAVCAGLAPTPRYPVAWVSRPDEAADTLTPRTAAGLDVSNLAARPLADDLASVDEVDVLATGVDGGSHTVTVTLVHGGRLHGVLQLSTPTPPDGTERRDLAGLGVVVSAALDATAAPTDPHAEVERYGGVLSHELRNYLQTAHSHLALAQEDGEEHVERVREALERIGRLADEAELIATGRVVPDDRTVRDLAETAEAAWAHVHAPAAELAVVDSVPIEAHHGLLEVLLENLFRNSVEHGGDAVRVGTIEGGFYVEDDGPGIPPDDRDRVLEWGYSAADGGSGFGLAVVRLVAEAHGWSLEVVEAEHGGARFEVTGH